MINLYIEKGLEGQKYFVGYKYFLILMQFCDISWKVCFFMLNF